MNTSIRYMRPDLAKRFEEHMGKSVLELFGEYEDRHHKSGRLVKEEIFPMHYLAFPGCCVHAENVGGDIEHVLNTRCIIGAFPWEFEGGEACPCRTSPSWTWGRWRWKKSGWRSGKVRLTIGGRPPVRRRLNAVGSRRMRIAAAGRRINWSRESD